MRIVIFGLGRFYQKRKKELLSYKDIELVAAVDNNEELQDSYIEEIPVFRVREILVLEFDIILLMSLKAAEMKKQLLDLGVDIKKIWYWQQFKSTKVRGSFHFYCGNSTLTLGEKKILILSSDLGYHGSALATVYAAQALQKKGYNVVLAAPEGNPIFINEMKNSGLNVMLCPALPYLYEEELAFIDQFDLVIVNTFPMILCASEISKRKPTIWWIHEVSILYRQSLDQLEECVREEKLEKINIYAVSRIAQDNFNQYFPNRIRNRLVYGIPDEREMIAEKSKNDQIIFAVIGGVIPLKAQDIFLKAIKELPFKMRKNASFWIIGKLNQDSYSNEIRDLVAEEPSTLILGEMTREEIKKTYNKIDVLVCPSLEDPLPIVVTEAMMYGKVCIVSDSVGNVDYISDGENGFICKTGNPAHLAEKMRWVIEHKDNLRLIGERARKIYEQYFIMDKFADRLEEEILSAIKHYPE